MGWLVMTAAFWHSASYGQFLSTVAPTLELAMGLVPVLVMPFMVVGGLYVS